MVLSYLLQERYLYLIKKLKSITNTEEKKRLVSNVFALSALQGVNFILPLITLPYLVRVLGMEYFGLLAFATALIAYLSIITNYGFSLTATREISIHRENKDKVIEIFSSVMIIKFILMFVSFLLMSIFVFSIEKFSDHWEIYFFTFGTIVGQILFPGWFFQGMERMKYITYLNILAKSIFTIAIFIFVQEQDDYYMVPVLTSIGSIIAGVLSLIIIKKEFNINFEFQAINKVIFYLKDGWYIFIASLSGNFYGQGNIIILGLFTTPAIVGYYSVAVRLATAIVKILKENSSINPGNLTAAGRGEFAPIATNDTAEGKAKNRRIEVILTPKLDEITKLLNDI